MFECEHCHYQTEFKNNMRKHLLARHVPKPRKPNAKYVRCALCEFDSPTRPDVVKHYFDVHGIKCEVKHINFDSMASFELWKDEIEMNGKAHYVSRRGARSRGNFSYQTYYCHRDGCYEAKGKGKRNVKKMGSIKINGCCPSQINFKSCISTGEVSINFIADHAGHGNDIEKLPIRKAEKKQLAERLAAGETFDKIINNVRETIISNDSLERIHLITRQDLANTVRDFKLNRDVLRRQGIASKVESCISEMEKSGNTVKFYKPQGVNLPENPSLSVTDFVLIFANDEQIELLREYGSDLIWFEGTYGPNRDCFKLTTLLTVDDSKKGVPCCFMLSNRWDTFMMALLTGVIMNAVGGVIQTTTFMSDLTDEYYNGWCTVMPTPMFRLFCSWHVTKIWEEKALQTIPDEDEAAVSFQRLIGIQCHPNEFEFPLLLEAEIDRLKANPSTEEFGNFVESEFSSNVRRWAHCYRKYCRAHTNASLESMHNTLHHVYVGEKKTRRLDKAIAALIKYVQDLLFQQVVSLNQVSASKKSMAIRKRHSSALEMSLDSVTKTTLGWSVACESSIGAYEVVLNSEVCDCSLRCEMCNCCIHYYRCNCLDCAIKWNMCKHIHLVVLYEQQQQQPSNTFIIADLEEEAMEEGEGMIEVEIEEVIDDRGRNGVQLKVEAGMDDVLIDEQDDELDDSGEAVIVESGGQEVLEDDDELIENGAEEVLEDWVEDRMNDRVEEMLDDGAEEVIENEAEVVLEDEEVIVFLQNYDETTSDHEPEATIIFDDLPNGTDVDENSETVRL
ncbi:unnamed protein product [Nesidiocoris tenuis]|uniref:C2H2-type domain-containing protein n=1 Tax=Nesidiocoris tenuis TaxID=355587 RepID=A0A6H5G3C2_9HEMI|nr:unnamed protein product [Nesidiocoris tenuis]